jgi:mRNA interferase MazF
MRSAPQIVVPSRGDVVTVNLDPTVGREQNGQRPALVVSDDALNKSPAGIVIVVPITGTNRGIPAHVPVEAGEGGLDKASVIMADQVRTISIQRIGRRLGRVSPSIIGLVEDRLRLVLGLS